MLKFVFSTDMPFENVRKHIMAHEEALRFLRDELPKACEREGHRWNEPKRDDICLDSGIFIEGTECNGEDRGTPGYWHSEPKYAKAFSRTCRRCGAVDQRRAIEKVISPFDQD